MEPDILSNCYQILTKFDSQFRLKKVVPIDWVGLKPALKYKQNKTSQHHIRSHNWKKVKQEIPKLPTKVMSTEESKGNSNKSLSATNMPKT